MIDEKKVTAIILAGGKGKRMESRISKQYLKLNGNPILYYSLNTFENSIADEIILVVANGEEEYCKREIVEYYNLKKVVKIVKGGKERYHSVYNGLGAVGQTDIVMIHDGARPFITEDVIEKAARETIASQACVVGVKVKDTIKVSDKNNYIVDTPDRSSLWQVQTPQSFDYSGIVAAYEYILGCNTDNITDDAMVWEAYSEIPVKLIEGTYFNIKITTKEDMIFGEAILNNMKKTANN